MKNPFDELNSVIKSTSTMHNIYHHVLQTLVIKVNAKKETAHFNTYFSLQEIITKQKMKIL